MAISNGKAWTILNDLEKNLGYAVVERKQGGKQGGKTYLTEEGENYFWKNTENLKNRSNSMQEKAFLKYLTNIKGNNKWLLWKLQQQVLFRKNLLLFFN